MAWGMSAAQMDDAALTAGAARGSSAADRARAVRTIAAMSGGAEECAVLLAMLGLQASEGLSSSGRGS